MSIDVSDYDNLSEHDRFLLRCWKHKCDVLSETCESLNRQLNEEKERYTDAVTSIPRLIIERDVYRSLITEFRKRMDEVETSLK